MKTMKTAEEFEERSKEAPTSFYRVHPNGFYHLTSEKEPEPILVQSYFSSDIGCQVFGFNTYDGGGILPHWDLGDGTKVTPVKIAEKKVRNLWEVRYKVGGVETLLYVKAATVEQRAKLVLLADDVEVMLELGTVITDVEVYIVDVEEFDRFDRKE